MARFLLCLGLILAAGCGTAAPPPKVEIDKQNLFEGAYELEFEKIPGSNPTLKMQKTDIGDGNVVYFVDCQVGPNRFVIEKGVLKLNGKDCGALNVGDKLRLDLDGRIYVNGMERGK